MCLPIYYLDALMDCDSLIILKKIMLLQQCQAKVSVQFATESFVVYQTLVFFIYTCGKKL